MLTDKTTGHVLADVPVQVEPFEPRPSVLDPLAESVPVRLAGGISSDQVDGHAGIAPDKDHLGVHDYVTMMAAIIADRETTMPLSIGLFGEWGSGKSYFMGLLREQVARLAASGDDSYVREVVPIQFNAWHYADSNLWASLADEIFRGLAGPNESAAGRRDRLLRDLDGRLQRKKELQDATERAKETTARLRAQLSEAAATRADKAAAFVRAAAATETVGAALRAATRRLGVDEKAALRILAEEVGGSTGQRQELRRTLATKAGRVTAAAALVGFAVLVAGQFLWPQVSRWLTGTGLVSVMGVFAAGAGYAVRVNSGLRMFGEVAADLRAAAAMRAPSGTESRVPPDAVDALHQAESHEMVVKAQLDEVVARAGELARELAELRPGKRLYSFLADRADSDQYKSRLGLISMIRQDFDELVTLLQACRQQPAGESDDPGEDPPIDRIVLYIDDLDRCSPPQVVDVLQAVHLLLAIDLFVVVVGVDPRWLMRSLHGHYRTLLSGDGREAGDVWRESTPQTYLEKIFNIPFCLPAMDPDSFARLVHGVAGGHLASPRPAVAPAAESRSQVAVAGDGMKDGVKTVPSQPLTEVELTLIAAVGPLVRTPREAKRLLNLYRMIRSTRDLGPAARFLGDDGQPGEYQAVVLLLGLLSGSGKLLGDVLLTPPNRTGAVLGGLCRRPSNGRWVDFVDGLEPCARAGTWENAVVGAIPTPDLDRWRTLSLGLRPATELVTLTTLEAFQQWAPQISRFSFLLASDVAAGIQLATAPERAGASFL